MNELYNTFSTLTARKNYLKIYERIMATKSARSDPATAATRAATRTPRAAGLARAKAAADAEVLQSIGD